MQTRQLGSAGPTLSLVGLGGNNFGPRLDEWQTAEVVEAALESGITHFDTAEVYGDGQSEEFLGKAIGARRSEVTIASKFARRPNGEPYRPGILRERILNGCESSLRRLGTDYIDIYYQHHPDPSAPVEETLEALQLLLDQGKIRYAACSNLPASQVEAAVDASKSDRRAGFVAAQIHWNLLYREVERELVPVLQKHSMGIVPYFPLESGLLTGKYRQGEPFPAGSRLASSGRYASFASDGTLDCIEQLSSFAAERGHTLLELAFAWLAAQDGVASIIAGATSKEQVMMNVQAGNAWRISAEDLAAIPVRS